MSTSPEVGGKNHWAQWGDTGDNHYWNNKGTPLNGTVLGRLLDENWWRIPPYFDHSLPSRTTNHLYTDRIVSIVFSPHYVYVKCVCVCVLYVHIYVYLYICLDIFTQLCSCYPYTFSLSLAAKSSPFFWLKNWWQSLWSWSGWPQWACEFLLGPCGHSEHLLLFFLPLPSHNNYSGNPLAKTAASFFCAMF